MATATRPNRKYGWKHSLPDPRDHFAEHRVTSLPIRTDLRGPFMPDIWNQLLLGSCTAHGWGAAFAYEARRQGEAPFQPSRLFIYYNERAAEGDVNQDGGAQVRTGAKVLASQGVCPESEWVYSDANDLYKKKPSAKAYRDAVKHKSLNYARVNSSLQAKRACLASGQAFVFGFSVFDSFESEEVAKTGVVPMPNVHQEQILGGHCVTAVGYDDPAQHFIVRNSWGTGWGQQGYCTMPYAYLLDQSLASDFWTISLVS